ncbi:MAG: CvpA family protein [Tepidimonas sp.]|uniref:CvpA family protein n=1 Tax=Tepidimonas sp. TaxID=2002775 RepID=UPI00298EDF8F|nr:CvpA family protein [Tepidimonas sp.]MCS6810156.1 CvpA family protein [Tepidimonas sp.]MDW8335659.1 CvpA family protein [Tepidimonas sp.]
MGPVDLLLLAVWVVSVVIGWWRGLLYEVVSLLGWVAAFVVAQQGALTLAARLPMEGWAPPLRYAAGFALLFVAVVLAAGLLAWALQRGAAAVGLRPVDRMLGGMFGALRGAVVLMVLALLVRQTPWAAAPAWTDSVGVRWLERGLVLARMIVPASVAEYFPDER